MEEEESSEKRQGRRGQNYSLTEVRFLVDLVQKYKNIIMNKSISGGANRAKDYAWVRIAQAFNKRGFGCVRDETSLKIKWDNLKKRSRLMSKDGNPIYDEISELIHEFENSVSNDIPEDLAHEIALLADISAEGEKDPTSNSEQLSNDEEHMLIGGQETLDTEKKNRVRALNFSNEECLLLLQCVKKEKHCIFNRSVSTTALERKNLAWLKITKEFNSLNQHKRDTRTLRNKFKNIRNLVRLIDADNTKRKSELDSCAETVKKEPNYDSQMDEEWIDDDYDLFEEQLRNDDNVDHQISTENHNDPLSSVLDDVLETGSDKMAPSNHSETQDIDRLKTELLNYQLETAKLERKRVESVIKEDAKDRESRELERALRLRVARLHAIAAARRFPSGDPALKYPIEEQKAQEYLEFLSDK